MCATGIVFLQAAIAPSLFVSDPQLFCPLTTQSPNTLYIPFLFLQTKKIAKSLDISSWAVKSLDLVFNFSGLHWTKKYINAIQIYYVYKYPCWELFFWQQIILLHAETNQPWPNKNIFYDCMWFSEQSPCLWHENRDKILNDRGKR